MRVAIWSAVSTAPQAMDDKYSLENQLLSCRRAAESRGWLETAGPFQAPGDSRTHYVNLSDAEKDIPDLHALLESAKRREYDLLVMYDYDRFRDLLLLIKKSLDSYQVQTVAVTSWIDPVPPDEFDPYLSDAANMMISMKAMLSSAEIAKLRRNYKRFMPVRAAHGLPHRVRYGYVWTSNKTPPVLDRERARFVVMIKDLFLAGKSLSQIARSLAEAGAPVPGNPTKISGGQHRGWQASTVRKILTSPFYAGIVRWGEHEIQRDPRDGKKRLVVPRADPRQIVTARGQHEPLWDEATHNLILGELKARSRSYAGARRSQLSQILRCATCGAMMHFWRPPIGSRRNPRWRCSARAGHRGYPHAYAVEQVGLALRDMVLAPAQSESETPPPAYDAQIADLKARRQRWDDAYESGDLTIKTYVERTAALDAQMDKLQRLRSDTAGRAADQLVKAAAMAVLRENAEDLPGWLRSMDPAQVNHMLRVLFEKMVIGADGRVALTRRVS